MQVPVSALLVFLVGRLLLVSGATIVDTLIGAGVAVIAVLLSPSAPGPDAVMSKALAPLRRCTEILRAISTASVDLDLRPSGLMAPGGDHADRHHRNGSRGTGGHQLSTRWNARAHRERTALGRAEEALLFRERIAIYTRSMARALLTDRTMPVRCRLSARCSRRRRRPRRLHRVDSLGRTYEPTADIWPTRFTRQTTPSAARSPG